MTRSRKSFKNLLYAIVGQTFGLIISFISRIVFIKVLGSEYLGLNGLFTNILTVLSLAELGVGEAITYSLYKPLANKDEYRCSMLMQFYEKTYLIIGIFIFVIGIAITPILPFLINDMPDLKNINLIYMLFVVNTSVSYFFSYKRNLIIADQNRYIATLYRYLFYFILNIVQIIFLILNHNYILFLILQIFFTLAENICVSFKANKMYPFLKKKESIKLDNDTKNEIVKNTKAMILHRIGGVVVGSTDNILLSYFVGLTAVGFYSNYYLIINALNLILGQIFSSLTASVGNLIAIENKERQYDVFKKINFMNYWLFSFSSICLLCLFNNFIELWVGSEYLFSFDIVLILVINFYITGMRKTVLMFRDASGLFYKDRWKAVLEALINLAFSIPLAIKFGTVGVFIGTLISSLTTCIWIEPYILHKYCFNKSLKEYFADYFNKILLTILIALLTYGLCNLILFNGLISLIFKLIICVIVVNVIYIVIFHKTDEYLYFYNKFVKMFLNKLIKRLV